MRRTLKKKFSKSDDALNDGIAGNNAGEASAEADHSVAPQTNWEIDVIKWIIKSIIRELLSFPWRNLFLSGVIVSLYFGFVLLHLIPQQQQLGTLDNICQAQLWEIVQCSPTFHALFLAFLVSVLRSVATVGPISQLLAYVFGVTCLVCMICSTPLLSANRRSRTMQAFVVLNVLSLMVAIIHGLALARSMALSEWVPSRNRFGAFLTLACCGRALLNAMEAEPKEGEEINEQEDGVEPSVKERRKHKLKPACKHRCIDKALCGHVCCKVALESPRTKFTPPRSLSKRVGRTIRP
jgi:hypothetical protein